MSALPSTNPDIQSAFDSQDHDEDIWQIEDLLGNLDKVAPQHSTLKSCFDIIPSKKERGKNYHVNAPFQIVATKSGSFFPVELKGIGIGDLIRTSILYDHEDHEMETVKCLNSKSGHQNVFQVMPRTQGLVPHMENELGLCSATLVNRGCATDVAVFRVIPYCMNSCSKVCSERLLKFEHLSNDGMILASSTWSIRVCSNLKRDFDLMVDTIEPVTGEKRKSLYSKVPRNKKIKQELGESSAPIPLALGDSEPRSTWNAEQAATSLATREANETAVQAAVELLMNDNAGGRASVDGPSSSGPGMIDDVTVINIYGNDTPPLMEEKVPPVTFRTVEEPSGEAPSAQLTRPPMLVQMNSMEDEDLVRKLVRRLQGTVHELKRTTP